MLAQKCALARCAVTKDLKSCAACNIVSYCCKEHQVEHFKEGGHKMICPGRQKGEPLKFPELVEKAQKFHSQQMFVAALPYYSAMLELTERQLGLFHPQVGNILNVMCTCYENSGHLDHAAVLLQREILIKELTGEENIETTKQAFFSMGRLAEIYMKMGHLDLAKELLTKMDTTAKDSFGEQSFERGRALCSLAGCLERNEEIDEAEKKLLECIALTDYVKPADKSKLSASAVAFFNLGMIYFTHQKKFQDAKERFQQALQMQKQAGLAGDHPDVVESSKMVEECKSK